MIDVLGQAWLPVLLTFLVTTGATLGLLLRRVPEDLDHAPTSGDAPDVEDDAASS